MGASSSTKPSRFVVFKRGGFCASQALTKGKDTSINARQTRTTFFISALLSKILCRINSAICFVSPYSHLNLQQAITNAMICQVVFSWVSFPLGWCYEIVVIAGSLDPVVISIPNTFRDYFVATLAMTAELTRCKQNHGTSLFHCLL
ncbi:MAG: hypothetical protein HW402_1427 [Dehalococcoidales bacterium]|nr:hypothetical protein [Dehalococcoidales bacterium]